MLFGIIRMPQSADEDPGQYKEDMCNFSNSQAVLIVPDGILS